jgi:hypothetical protein
MRVCVFIIYMYIYKDVYMLTYTYIHACVPGRLTLRCVI